MIIYGASGHAKVIIDLIESLGKDSIDFIIDDNHQIKQILGHKVIHDIDEKMDDCSAVVAIGNNRTRQRIVKEKKLKFSPAIIHRSAILSPRSFADEGSVVLAQAVINAGAKIGKHCIINTAAVIEHDVSIEDYVHVSPSATITGNVEIGEGTQIGAGATVIPGIKIGKWVTIGAGAVVISDIPDYSVVVGNPAKIIKYSSIDE